MTNARTVKNIMSSADQWAALKQAANAQGIVLVRSAAAGSRSVDVLATNDPWAAFAAKQAKQREQKPIPKLMPGEEDWIEHPSGSKVPALDVADFKNTRLARPQIGAMWGLT